MSIRLILEEYLGMMKESGELDAFLPELLTAMDHAILSEPQRGVRQFGVDLVSRGPDGSGAQSLHLWILKSGDIDRASWNSGNQSIRSALVEIEDVYLRTHVPPAEAALPTVVHILTNGDFRQEVDLEISQYLHTFCVKTGARTERENGSVLARWTEQFLVDEHVLPNEFRSLFRKTLAMVENPDTSYAQARALIEKLLTNSFEGSDAARRKGRLRALRAVLVANKVLIRWAENAGNLDSAYRACEFALLKGWCFIAEINLWDDKDVRQVFAGLFGDFLSTSAAFCSKLEPYYTTENAFAAFYQDNLLVVDRVFEELGRLGLLACAYRLQIKDGTGALGARRLADRIVALLESHAVSGSPCFDRQSVDISLAMLGLLAGGRSDAAIAWLGALVKRLEIAKKIGRFTPISSTSFEDLVAVRSGAEPETGVTPFATSTLVPILGIWATMLRHDAAWEHLANIVAPAFSETTFNLWTPDDTYGAVLASEVSLGASGYADAFTELPKDKSKFQSMLGESPQGVPNIDSIDFVARGWPWLGLLASRHWKLQVSHSLIAMLVDQIAAS
jgi:hypothetical protein